MSTSGDTIERLLSTLRLAEGLKRELRHSWLSNGRQESVAEHTFQMALMAILMARYLEEAVDLERTLTMILVHDLVEAVAGDVPWFEDGERKKMKAVREREAIEQIRSSLPVDAGDLVFHRWNEFEEGLTAEARFARALDNLEVQIQHNLASLDTWLPIEYELVHSKMDPHCDYDPFLRDFCRAVKKQAETKISAAGIRVDGAQRVP